jgi:UDP-2,3-diacylglucosamine pyrophosphatase LpxH
VDDERAPLVFRSVFISDIHLGTRGCQAELLLDFLRSVSCEQLYLVGDIVDGWRMKRGWFWPQSHNDVVQKLLRHARKGVAVTYIPGNHDERVREYCGVHFGGVVVAREAIHQAADGRRLLVLHGDEFDAVVRLAPWLARAGDLAYRLAIRLNTLFNRVRRRLGLPYWSLSAFLKIRVKNALQFIDNYETAVATEARRRGVDGVICGHIHKAEMREIHGIVYMNDGDWVESCTALVERLDGRFEILRWAEERSWSMIRTSRRARSASAPMTEPAIA